jgi:hypothetical protein
MATTRTADDAKEAYVAAMGPELGEVFAALWQEVAWVHRRWDEYVELYARKPTRVELLNEAAPTFFRIVQDLLWEQTLLHIARLTDPPKSAGKSNLTIQQLAPLIADPGVSEKVASAIKAATDASQFCRDWRNRHIAHRDLGLALDRGAQPLSPASREKVRMALQSIVSVLNEVSGHYMDTTSIFDLGGEIGGAVALLHVIDDGLKHAAQRLHRLQTGEVVSDDVRARDL